MSDERRRILEMLAQGKISVADAERLLQALGADDAGAGPAAAGSSQEPGAARPAGGPPKFLHVHVRKNPQGGPDAGTGPAAGEAEAGWDAGFGWRGRGAGRAWRGHAHGHNHDVDVRIPVSLLRSGMKLAAIMPGRTGAVVSNKLKERGIDVDFSRLDPDQLDEVLRNLGDLTVDLDHGRGQVRIYCE
ncbi:MAG: hypothetical protein KGN76_13350 [Acidobacteriota bacterium]|nr:hypothetical protein [Acidobacteriota bacterium]